LGTTFFARDILALVALGALVALAVLAALVVLALVLALALALALMGAFLAPAVLRVRMQILQSNAGQIRRARYRTSARYCQ
jgi:ABC-type dipeptide/oligopeptide/nickel transport system permease subunit